MREIGRLIWVCRKLVIYSVFVLGAESKYPEGVISRLFKKGHEWTDRSTCVLEWMDGWTNEYESEKVPGRQTMTEREREGNEMNLPTFIS